MSEFIQDTTVMIVDDIPANLKLLNDMLSAKRFRVLQFPRAQMALQAAGRTRPDLILLDIMMPEMDGFEMCRRLKADEQLKDIPVIFISALDDTADKVKAFTEGGVDYVSKPFHAEEVLARVNTHLRLRRQQIRIESQEAEIRRNYEQLRELEQLRDNLVHMIAHDMRSPLLGIVGFAEMIREDLRETAGQEVLEMLDDLIVSGHNLRDMINDLLDVSRLEADKMPLDCQACHAPELVRSAVDSLGAITATSEISIQAPDDNIELTCDPEITRRIIANLIGNAVKFSGNDCKIKVACARDNGSVRFSVTDDGPGIPPEFQQEIFNKFSQVRNHKAGRKFSTGLGLVFCKLAVEAHNGEIGLESQPGDGSTFWFSLPVA